MYDDRSQFSADLETDVSCRPSGDTLSRRMDTATSADIRSVCTRLLVVKDGLTPAVLAARPCITRLPPGLEVRDTSHALSGPGSGVPMPAQICATFLETRCRVGRLGVCKSCREGRSWIQVCWSRAM